MTCARTFVAIVVSASPWTFAQQLPTAEQVLDRYVAVTGGQSAYDRVQNQVLRTSASMSGQILAQSTDHITRDGKFRHSTAGAEETGINDGVAWIKTKEKAEILESGPQRAIVLRSGFLLSDSQWRRYYSSAKMAGMTTVDGRPCYELAVNSALGGSQTLDYEFKTGLLLRHSEPGTAGSGDVEITAREYFEVEGIKMPRRLLMKLGATTLEISVDELRFNQVIPDSTFALPPEIARLARKRFVARPLPIAPAQVNSRDDQHYLKKSSAAEDVAAMSASV